MELPEGIQQAVDRYLPVEAEGVTLYPIRVKEYRAAAIGQPAIACLQQGLPPAVIGMPLMQAFFQLDLEAKNRGTPGNGWMARCLLFLALALEIGPKGDDRGRLEQFDLAVDTQRPDRLKGVYFTQNGRRKKITPVGFSRLRPILAAQNGISLQSNDANPELVEAEVDVLDQQGGALEGGMENIISGVSALCGAEEREIAEWPLLKLERRRRSWERVLGYLVYGIGEAAGGQWKGGNPRPSPWFDRKEGLSAALRPLDQFAGGEGRRAMERAGFPAL